MTNLEQIEHIIKDETSDDPEVVYFINLILELVRELRAAREVIAEAKTRHQGENNRLAWAIEKYDAVVGDK